MVDLSKYPVEKLFHFVAGIIPGAVVLFLMEIASPGKFSWLFSLPFLGYRTKLSLIVLAAFVVGNSMTVFLTMLIGALGGAIGAVMASRPFQPAFRYEVAAWRDLRWRVLVRSRLGGDAPRDIFPMSRVIYEMRLKMIGLKPEAERLAAINELNLELHAGNIEDGRWQQWYDHFH